MMKFALNHDYRFTDYKIAFLAGFLQSLILFIIEMVNIACILTANSILDVVMNFMALAIIADFDDVFYTALGEDDNKVIVSGNSAFEHIYMIQKTSSRDAAATNPKNQLIDDCHPKAIDTPDWVEQTPISGEYIGVLWSKRTPF